MNRPHIYRNNGGVSVEVTSGSGKGGGGGPPIAFVGHTENSLMRTSKEQDLLISMPPLKALRRSMDFKMP